MIEYPKIRSIFKRNDKTHKFIEGQYSLPEFEYLKDNAWEFTEKIDGTNIRVDWNLTEVEICGRTDSAQMPPFLSDKLDELFPASKFKEIYPDMTMCLFGEGFGAKIQKGGGNYLANSVNFILFDVLIDDWWLKRADIIDVAKKLGILYVPLVGIGTIQDAVILTKAGFDSVFGSFRAEGLVLKPEVGLRNRARERIVTKMKCSDFYAG